MTTSGAGWLLCLSVCLSHGSARTSVGSLGGGQCRELQYVAALLSVLKRVGPPIAALGNGICKGTLDPEDHMTMT